MGFAELANTLKLVQVRLVVVESSSLLALVHLFAGTLDKQRDVVRSDGIQNALAVQVGAAAVYNGNIRGRAISGSGVPGRFSGVEPQKGFLRHPIVKLVI